MRARVSLALVFVTLTAACAVGGRGSGSDDDDSSSDPTSGNGFITGGGGAGSGGSTSSSGDITGAPNGSNSATNGSGSTGPTGSTGASGGGACPTTNLVFNDPVCGSCIEGACCSALQACDASTACLDYLDCVMQCTDTLCEDSCMEFYPTGYSQLTSLDSCTSTSCSFECGA